MVWKADYKIGSSLQQQFSNKTEAQPQFPSSKLKLELVSSADGHTFTVLNSLGIRSVAVFTGVNPEEVPSEALTLNFFDEETDGLGIGSYGDFAKVLSIEAGVSIGSYCEFPTINLFEAGTSSIAIGSYADIYMRPALSNWVLWATDELDFTVEKSNVAGRRPMDWKGTVYAIKKLGDKVVTYGENGVSVLNPMGKTYGLNTVYRIGLKGKNAIAGSDSLHFFVDNKGQLFSFGEFLKRLDYSEFLSSMTDPVLSWDEENSLLYICDGTLGYVYSTQNKSLGACSPLITGLTAQGGTLIVTSSGAIVTPVFEICTDIYDLGTKRNKTIFELEFGTNVSVLNASIDYRSDFSGVFSQTAWKDVSERGNVFITALGREFRIRVKVPVTYEYLEMDYININGIVHAH